MITYRIRILIMKTHIIVVWVLVWKWYGKLPEMKQDRRDCTPFRAHEFQKLLHKLEIIKNSMSYNLRTSFKSKVCKRFT